MLLKTVYSQNLSGSNSYRQKVHPIRKVCCLLLLTNVFHEAQKYSQNVRFLSVIIAEIAHQPVIEVMNLETSNFEKNFYKFMHSTFFDKIIEDIRPLIDLRLCSTLKRITKLVTKLKLKDKIIVQEKLGAIH